MNRQRDGESGVAGLAGVLAIAVAPDGRNVHAAAPDSHAVAVFARDPETGALTEIEVQRDGPATSMASRTPRPSP